MTPSAGRVKSAPDVLGEIEQSNTDRIRRCTATADQDGVAVLFVQFAAGIQAPPGPLHQRASPRSVSFMMRPRPRRRRRGSASQAMARTRRVRGCCLGWECWVIIGAIPAELQGEIRGAVEVFAAIPALPEILARLDRVAIFRMIAENRGPRTIDAQTSGGMTVHFE